MAVLTRFPPLTPRAVYSNWESPHCTMYHVNSMPGLLCHMWVCEPWTSLHGPHITNLVASDISGKFTLWLWVRSNFLAFLYYVFKCLRLHVTVKKRVGCLFLLSSVIAVRKVRVILKIVNCFFSMYQINNNEFLCYASGLRILDLVIVSNNKPCNAHVVKYYGSGWPRPQITKQL